MGIKINEYPIEGTDINDDSYIDVDQWNGTGYESNKVKWLTVLSTAIRGFAKLASNNIFTGTNQFNKQVKIVSDGTNSPLVVRDSTDLKTYFEVLNGGVVEIYQDIYAKLQFKNISGVRGEINVSDFFVFNSVGGRYVFNSPALNYFLISQSGTSADPTAIFQVDSTTKGVLIPRLTTTQRNAMGGTLPTSLLIFNSTNNQYEFWNGSAWTGLGGVSWGGITGTLSAQTDLQTALDTKAENGANVGAVGSGIFKDKTGTTLNFRKLVNAGGIGVAINGDNVELTNQHVNIADMNDTFFGTLVANDLIQWDGTEWVNVQPSTLPISTATQTALNLKQDKGLHYTLTTTNNTLTAITTVNIPNNTNKGIYFILKGRNNTTGTQYFEDGFAVFNSISGTTTQQGTLSSVKRSGFPNSVQINFSIVGNVVTINVTGATGQTIDWDLEIVKIA